LDIFEEELENDYEEMLSKFERKKVMEVRNLCLGVGGGVNFWAILRIQIIIIIIIANGT